MNEKKFIDCGWLGVEQFQGSKTHKNRTRMLIKSNLTEIPRSIKSLNWLKDLVTHRQ